MLVVAVGKYNDSPEVRRSFNKPTRALGFEGSYNKIPSRKSHQAPFLNCIFIKDILQDIPVKLTCLFTICVHLSLAL